MRNLSSYRRETKKALRLPKAVTVFLLCGLLTVTILIPTQSALSDDDAYVYPRHDSRERLMEEYYTLAPHSAYLQ